MLQSSSNDVNGESYEVAPLEEASRYSDVWYGMTNVTDDTIHDLQGESYDVASLEQATNYSGLWNDTLITAARQKISCDNARSNTFFTLDRSRKGGGSTYLITMAITETSTFVGDMLHPRDVTYHMMVGKFINNLTRL